MFEKEAEEYGIASRKFCVDVVDSDLIAEAYKDGAEFGYNKANEWHYPSKGEFPKDDNDVLVLLKDETMLVDYYFSKIGWNLSCKNDVIAWKEIVLPELKESE